MIDKWLTHNDIARFLSTSIRWIQKRASNEDWQYRSYTVRGGKERRYHIANLPEDVQTAYAAGIKTTLADLQSQFKPLPLPEKKVCIPGFAGRGAKTREAKNYDRQPEKYREAADCRRQLLEAYSASELPASEFVKAYNGGGIVPELRAKLGPYGKIKSQSSLYRWLEQYEKDGIAGLAPQYAGKGAGASLSQEAKDRIEWLFLDSGQPSSSVVWELLSQYGIEAGESTVRRYINALPEWIKSKYRKGREYCKGRFSPYIIRDYTNYKPMEIVCGDYMTQDIVCRKGEKIFRARLCAFEDMRSRVITGWSLQETANSIGVIRALQMTFRDYGLPEKIYVDNGKEFKNYLLCGDQWKAQKTKIDPELLDTDVGILAECGIKVIFCQTYNGQSKPIERFWRFFHDRFDRFEQSYMGSSFAGRPEEAKVFRNNVEDMKKEDLTLIPTFEEVEKRIGNLINWYNDKWHHGGQGMEDRTPKQVMAEYAVPRRDIPEHLKKYLFTMRYIRTVQRSGIVLDEVYYQNLDGKLVNHIGKKVEVRRGLDDAGAVHIFSVPDRVYVCDAEQLKFTGVVQEDMQKTGKLKKEMRELEKKYNRKKAEYDKGVFKTPAEQYAEEQQAVNGAPLRAPVLPFIKPPKTSKRKIVGIFDVD